MIKKDDCCFERGLLLAGSIIYYRDIGNAFKLEAVMKILF